MADKHIQDVEGSKAATSGLEGRDLGGPDRAAAAIARFERRRRGASRFALYTSLALSLSIVSTLFAYLGGPVRSGYSQEWYRVDFLSFPEVVLLQRLVQVDTTPETGDEVAAARLLAEELSAVGVEAHIEEVAPRRANLWAILEGDDPEALVLLSHLDVEPIHFPEAWKHPPFEGRIERPWIFGRGTFDMKSVTAAQMEAFLAVARSGERPRRTLIFLSTSSEETGSVLGLRWMLRERPELFRRFWGVLTEGGWLEARSVGDLKYWGVEIGQKRYVDLWVRSHSRGQLEEILEGLVGDKQRVGEPKLVPEVRTFLASYAESRDLESLRQSLSDPDHLLRDPAAFAKLPPYIKALFRNELVPFGIQEASSGGFELHLKLHLLPGEAAEPVQQQLLPAELTQGLTVTLAEPDPESSASPTDHPLFQAAVEVLRKGYPEVRIGPLFLPWTATDSRLLRAAGIPSYGFSPFLILTTDTVHVSGPNERISLPGFVEGVRLYKELVWELAFEGKLPAPWVGTTPSTPTSGDSSS